MQRQLARHLAALAAGLLPTLFLMQNCGDDRRDFRSAIVQQSALENNPQQSSNNELVQLSIDIDGEEISQEQAAGLSLVPTLAGFKAQLFCGVEAPVDLSSSPVLVSANADCKVGLSELSFGGVEGTYSNIGGLTKDELVQGKRHIFQNAQAEQLIVQVVSQFSMQDRAAKAAFRFYQVRRDKATASAVVKEFVVDGQLAPDLRVATTDLGMSNAGILLRTNFKCSAVFKAANGKFSCGDFSSDELRLVYEPLVKMIDFDQIENEIPDSIDGPKGVIAQLSKISKPLSDYAFTLTADGFALSLILGDVNSGRAFGLPEQILLGVGTAQGGVATTVINLDILN